MKHVLNDGGRAAAGYKGTAGDCVTRAIAIAADLPYEKVRKDLMGRMASWRATSRSKAAKTRKSNSVRNGTPKAVAKPYILSLGFEWVPIMEIGSGVTHRLVDGDLPKGRVIVSLSRHYVAVIDGVIHDTYDPSRFGRRAVYGYYIRKETT